MSEAKVSRSGEDGDASTRRALWTLDWLAPMAVGCAVGLAIALLIEGGSLHSALAAGAQDPSQSNTVQLAGELELLKDRLAIYQDHLDTFLVLITVLLGVAALVGVAIPVASYLTSRRYVEQASSSASQIHDLREFAEDEAQSIRRQFPIFGNVHARLEEIVAELQRLLPLLDEAEKYYRRLEPSQKQQIYVYERAIAIFELLNPDALTAEVAAVYRGLGNFYALRGGETRQRLDRSLDELRKCGERCGREATAAIECMGTMVEGWLTDQIAADLDRAELYLRRAVDRRPDHATLNDLAQFLVKIRTGHEERAQGDRARFREWRQEALHLSQESLRRRPHQQRARFNLAVFAHQEQNYRKSESLLSEALKEDIWQLEAHPIRLIAIHYNRACARCRLASLSTSSAERSRLLRQAWNDLEPVLRSDWIEEALDSGVLEADLKSGGDLAPLVEDEPYASEPLLKEALTGKGRR